MGESVSLNKHTRSTVARLTGCNSETVRYYERVGLLSKPERGDNGYRYYNDSQVAQLRFISRAKRLGFSTDALRELLEIASDSGEHTRTEVKSLTENHIRAIRNQISELKQLENTLTQIARSCDGARESADHCPILASLFKEEQSSSIEQISSKGEL